MQTTVTPIPTPRKYRRRWYAIAGFVTLVVATPYLMMLVSTWLEDRELAQIYAEIDAEDPNWRWADLIANQPKPPADERNAALQVAKVAKLRGATDVLPKWHDAAMKHPNARLPDDCLEALRKVINRSDPTKVAEARKLRDMPEGCLLIPASEEPWKGVGSLCLDYLGVMRLLQYDAWLRAADGDLEGAAESCQAILNAAHAIGDCPALMAQFVRVGGVVMAATSIERTLGQGAVSDARLRSLYLAMSIEAERNGMYHALRGERAGAQQLYLLERAGKDSPFRELRNQGGMKGRMLEMFPSLYLRGFPDYFRNLGAMIRAAKLPEQAQAQALETLEDQRRKADQNRTSVGNLWDSRFLLGAFQDQWKDRARLRCAIVAIAAERYRLQHEAWPIDAGDLVKAGLLKERPVDPYDGQPLRWKQTAENLIIYSVGPTKIDDGGKLSKYGTRPDGLGFVLWVPQMRGLPAPPPEKTPR